MTPERVAIVGSRDYPDLEEVAAYVRTLPAGTVVVSGGARGVDREAESAALSRGLAVESWRVSQDQSGYRVTIWQWGPNGHVPTELTRGTGFLSFGSAAYWRNGKVVERADRVVAFWDGRSRGTRNSIALAESAGKPVTVHRPKVVL